MLVRPPGGPPEDGTSGPSGITGDRRRFLTDGGDQVLVELATLIAPSVVVFPGG